MRALLYICLASALGAQAPLRILAVERKVPPPYEEGDRVYRLDGGVNRGLRPGDRLTVRRAGEPRPMGWLKVTEVRAELAEARLDAAGAGYLLKGDLVWKEELKGMPALEPLSGDPLPKPVAPLRGPEAPALEGVLFFLPQRSDLSPAGLRKLEEWVASWGTGGRWQVQIPASKALSTALLRQRAETLQGALRALGVAQATLLTEPRGLESKYDPAWVRHQD
jgi:hypothetical protein